MASSFHFHYDSVNIMQSRNEIKPTILQNCFRHDGLMTRSYKDQTDEDELIDEDDLPVAQLARRLLEINITPHQSRHLLRLWLWNVLLNRDIVNLVNDNKAKVRKAYLVYTVYIVLVG